MIEVYFELVLKALLALVPIITGAWLAEQFTKRGEYHPRNRMVKTMKRRER